MEIKEIKNKEIWEGFLLKCEEKTFLDSWNWGEFNKMMGNKIWRLGIFRGLRPDLSPLRGRYQEGEEGDPLSVALVIKIQAKRGTFLFIPHGPNIKSKLKNRASIYRSEGEEEDKVIFAYQNSKLLEVLLNELKKIAKEENTNFIRIAPILERNKENEVIFKELGFREAPIHIHPELTWELNITPPENELLMGMRKTTRYLIRQARKNKDIEISKSQDLENIKVFNSLYQETANRHLFVPFSFEYLKNEFLAFKLDNQILIFFGKYKGEIISSAIIIFWQNIAFYHHGASSLKYPKIPVSYLLQWKAILEAKKRGCKLYNFWGIADVNSKFKIQNSKFRKHPWAGLTLFKKGFGGYKKEYVQTQDFVISPKYWLTFIFEKLRKKRRGL